MGQYLKRDMLRLLVSAFQLNTGTVLTRSRWILNLEKQRCAQSKTLHKYFFICTHTLTLTQSWASLPAGTITLRQIIQCHTEPCLWPSGPLQTEEAAGQGPTAAWNSLPLGSSKEKSPSLPRRTTSWASTVQYVNVLLCLCVQDGLSSPWYSSTGLFVTVSRLIKI